NNMKHEQHNLSLVIEGLMSIQSGDNPRIVREKLEGFLSPKERQAKDGDSGGGRHPGAARRRKSPRGRRRGPPGGGMSRKAPEAAKAENHERWIVSYADMVTLLWALFVVLYAL